AALSRAAVRRERSRRLPRAVGVLRHTALLGEGAHRAAEAHRDDRGCGRVRIDRRPGSRDVRHTHRVGADDDSVRSDDGRRALRQRRGGARRSPRRESQRDRSARDPEAFRSWQLRCGGAATTIDIAGYGGRSTMQAQHAYPKLHNAMWPGLVGKGSPGAEPAIDLDTMLDLTAKT